MLQSDVEGTLLGYIEQNLHPASFRLRIEASWEISSDPEDDELQALRVDLSELQPEVLL